jgi:hypothetical protein
MFTTIGNSSVPKPIKRRVPDSAIFKVRMILQNSIPTSQKANHAPIAKAHQSMLFREMTFYPVHHSKHKNRNNDYDATAGGTVHTLTSMF